MAADVARQGVFAAERMPMTGADDCTTLPHWLLAFVAGGCVGYAMGPPALGTGFDTSGAKATCAGGSCAGHEVDIAVVAAALRVGAARGTGAATDLAAGAAEYLIFGAGGPVAASTPYCAVGTQRGLVNVAGKGMGWAHRTSAP